MNISLVIDEHLNILTFVKLDFLAQAIDSE